MTCKSCKWVRTRMTTDETLLRCSLPLSSSNSALSVISAGAPSSFASLTSLSLFPLLSPLSSRYPSLLTLFNRPRTSHLFHTHTLPSPFPPPPSLSPLAPPLHPLPPPTQPPNRSSAGSAWALGPSTARHGTTARVTRRREVMPSTRMRRARVGLAWRGTFM